MTHRHRATPRGILRRPNNARHAALGRTGAARVGQVVQTGFRLPQSMIGVVRPDRLPELGGAVFTWDTSAWYSMLRTAQTPTFCVVMTAGLALTWVGADAIAGPADGQIRQPPSANVVLRGSSPGPAPIGSRPADAPTELPKDYWQKFFQTLDEFPQSGGTDVVDSQPTVVSAPHCVPLCSDSTTPGPLQDSDPPLSSSQDLVAPATPSTAEQSGSLTAPTLTEEPAAAPAEQSPGAPAPAAAALTSPADGPTAQQTAGDGIGPAPGPAS